MVSTSDGLVIVLQVLEGINFQLTKPTSIRLVASLGRNSLETCGRPLTAGSGITFGSSLIWETDRESVRRMKTENLPIKVECYDGSAREMRPEPIGHIVIPLRSIALVASARVERVRPRWYRVIGISSEEWRRRKPEVHVRVFVTDRRFLEVPDTQDEPQDDGNGVRDRNVVIYANPEPSGLAGGEEGLRIELLEEHGLLQVGDPDNDTDIFLVKIVLRQATHLSALVGDANQFEYQMRYDLLGNSYPCRAERKQDGASYGIQEKIVINFRTSLHCLCKYFEKVFQMVVEFVAPDGERTVGRAVVKFGGLIEEDNLVDFLAKYGQSKNTFESERTFPIRGSGAELAEMTENPETPALKCKFLVKFIANDRGKRRLLEKPTPLVNSPPSSVTCEVREPDKVDIETILLAAEHPDLEAVPRTFSYKLLLRTVKFTTHPIAGLWQLSLQHPKADTPFTKVTIDLHPSSVRSETIDFRDLRLQLFFSSHPDAVLEHISCEPSKLTINGPGGLYAYAHLDNRNLLIGTREKLTAGVLIMENARGENVAMATIACGLEDIGVNYNSQLPPSVNVAAKSVPVIDPPASTVPFDEAVAYKMLEEQQQWLLNQRNAFRAELQRTEASHLLRLTEKWKTRKVAEERELASKLAHVEALTATLEQTRKTLEDRGMDELKSGQLESAYREKLEKLEQRTRQLEEDSERRVRQQRVKCEALENSNETLREENKRLLEKLSQLETELERCRRKAETDAEGFNRQLLEVQQSKLFYKQQWAKMVRETHKQKQDNERQLEDALYGRGRKSMTVRRDRHGTGDGQECNDRAIHRAQYQSEFGSCPRRQCC